jgi:hypothetical protein
VPASPIVEIGQVVSAGSGSALAEASIDYPRPGEGIDAYGFRIAGTVAGRGDVPVAVRLSRGGGSSVMPRWRFPARTGAGCPA